VGIVDAGDDPQIEADLGTFDTEYGLPACTSANGCFTKVGQTGSTTNLPPADTGGSDVETSLDVESVRAVCPDCKILLVEANSLTLPDLGASVNEAVTLGATEVSNSYGGAEAGSQSYAGDYSHAGVPITVSSGDQGYYDWVFRVEGQSAAAEANAPASYPGSVAVGGTSLALNADGSRASETVWNDQYAVVNEGAGGAGGGGCSTLFTAPSWQTSEAGYQAANCAGDRLVADVSADADPLTGFDVYDSYSGPGWETVGGTSLSAPIIAAVYGLAGGGHSAANPAQTLYTNSSSDAGSLYDVTSGGNGYCDDNYSSCTPPANDDCGQGSTACNAATGYDGPSGVGAPDGLAGFMAGTTYDPTQTTVSCSPGSGAEGVATTCTATVTDTASSGASNPTGVVAFRSSIAGAFGSTASCALAATGTTGVASCQLSFTPSSGGTYTVTGATSATPNTLAAAARHPP
jgi:subtilase family serine protease